MVFNESGEFITFSRSDNCFIYFLLNGNNVVYVGQTSMGISRPFSHHDKEYDSIKALPCPKDELDTVEDFYIAKYKPKYNKSRNYNTIFSLKKTKSLIRKYYNPDFNLWDLRKILSRLNIIPFRDDYTQSEYITLEQYRKIEEYIGG